MAAGGDPEEEERLKARQYEQPGTLVTLPSGTASSTAYVACWPGVCVSCRALGTLLRPAGWGLGGVGAATWHQLGSRAGWGQGRRAGDFMGAA